MRYYIQLILIFKLTILFALYSSAEEVLVISDQDEVTTKTSIKIKDIEGEDNFVKNWLDAIQKLRSGFAKFCGSTDLTDQQVTDFQNCDDWTKDMVIAVYL